MEIEVTNYGARLVSVRIPGKNGELLDVVLGYDSAEEYEKDPYCFGAIIGRHANRIKNAEFVLNGKTYYLSKNEYGNNIHSGPDGYQFRVWDIEQANNSCVCFSLVSSHLDQGFPGEFEVTVTYTLTENNEIMIHYEGMATADTIVNMTHHSYFNLNGHDSGHVLNQYLRIHAARYSPICDYQCIPTGEHAKVKKTPMDFLDFKTIGQDIEADFAQLKMAGDYNHNYILDKEKNTMGIMAEAYCKESGIYMSAKTDLPAVQLYTGVYIAETIGKCQRLYGNRSGFCLEAQYTPNAMNEEGEEKPILRGGEKYDKTVIYQFHYGKEPN
jgi:Galactose mutarotase and related enzymes